MIPITARLRGNRGFFDSANPVVREHPINQGLVSWLMPVRPTWGTQRMLDLMHLGTGALQGGSWASNPYHGLAVRLDGVDDYVDCGAPTVYDVAGASSSFSIVAWLRFTPTVTNTAISQKGSGVNSRPWQFFWTAVAGVNMRFQQYDGANNPLADAGTTPIADGAWHLVAGVRDCINSQMRVYVDGRDQTTNASNVAFTTNFDDTGIVTLGDNRNGLVDFMPGDVGGHWVYRRPLDEDDNRFLFDQAQRGFPELINYRNVSPTGITVAATHRFNAAYAAQANRIVSVGCWN